MKLQNEVAVITGAGPGNGIGKTIAQTFAKEGAKLVLNFYATNENDKEQFHKEIKEYEQEVLVVEGDISNATTAKKLIETALEEFGKIDILVNNAGISTPALLQDLTISNWDRMIEVNLRSAFLTTKFAIPSMINNRHGRVINISSQVAQKGSIEHCHYAAAKAGIIGFTKSLAREVGKHGITANCIAPGPISTQLMNEVSDDWKNGKMDDLVIPKFGKVNEVAPTALFLASNPEGNLYTGQTLGPNCGDVMI